MANSTLRRLYYNFGDQPGHSAYLANARTLLLAAKKENPSINKSQVAKFLKSSHVANLHALRRAPAKYLPYAVTNRNIAFSCDLAFFGGTPLLLCVDNFSGKILLKRLKNKTASETAKAMKWIIENQNESIWPTVMYAGTSITCVFFCNATFVNVLDDGSEWKGDFGRTLAEHHCVFHVVKTPQKAAKAERVGHVR